MRKGVIVMFLVATALAFSACTGSMPANDMKALRTAIEFRAKAVSSGDKELFMSLINQGDPEYVLEQSRWFDYRLSTSITDLKIEIDSVTPIDKNECAVALHQSYLIGTDRSMRDFRNVQRYKKINGAWLDSDMDFEVAESPNFTLRYQKGIDPKRIELISSHAEAAWNSVKKSYGEAPAGKIVLKIFSDQELLRQYSKITIDRLFNGWGEPGESIKMRLRPNQEYSYKSVLAHELVHKITLSTSMNFCSWWAEGTANYFGSFAAMGGTYLDGGFHTPSDYDKPIAWLEAFNPETVDNDEQWWLYGGMAGIVVQFIEKKFGSGKPQAIIRELGKYPQLKTGWVYSRDDVACREYLAGAIKTVLGISMEEFNRSWLDWIRNFGRN